ncbi:MAG: hypothetical protein COA46_11875 [Porticoccaceae bacterium]|nr:MAG: hypothetical protein COA46_11875 [Porticoccaceae bacterium]
MVLDMDEGYVRGLLKSSTSIVSVCKDYFLLFGFAAFLSSFMVLDNWKSVNNVFYGLVLLPLVFCCSRKQLIRMHRSWLVNLFFLFILYLVASSFWSSSFSMDVFFRYMKRAFYIYGFFVAVFVLVDDFTRFSQSVINYFAPVLLCFSVICLVVFYQEHDFPRARLLGQGVLTHPTFLSVVLLAYLGAFLWGFFDHFRAHGWIAAFSFIIGITVLILSQSRSSFVALIAMVVVALLIDKKSSRFYFLSICLIVLAGAVSYYMGLLTNRGMSWRPEIWSSVLERVGGCGMWFGCGYGGWESETVVVADMKFDHAHSMYLGQFFYGGVVALVSYICLLVGFLFHGLRVRSAIPWVLVLTAGVFVTLTEGNKLLITPSPIWLVLFLPMAMILAISLIGTGQDSET